MASSRRRPRRGGPVRRHAGQLLTEVLAGTAVRLVIPAGTAFSSPRYPVGVPLPRLAAVAHPPDRTRRIPRRQPSVGKGAAGGAWSPTSWRFDYGDGSGVSVKLYCTATSFEALLGSSSDSSVALTRRCHSALLQSAR